MKNSNAVVIWVLAGLGLVLVYSAYKNVSPVSIIKSSLTTPKTK